MGCENAIDRAAEGYKFWSDEQTQDEGEWRRLGKKVRSLIGEDPDIVFEHPGRSTFGASVFITKRGGTIVTCAATSGYMLEYDNRRSEEHTSELQSLMRISYAVFCLKKKNKRTTRTKT